ncbi:MAG: hypothetical protein LBC79_00540 [Deltaproteobacteria bacterium]|jgi:hypothetical protein|nr:hypothetical protein [Deltaproteobacteria bacterium]
MKQRALLFILCLFACCVLIYACVTDKLIWQGFEGTPAHGLRSYAAELRVSDIRDGTESVSGTLYIAQGRLRYEMQGAGPFEHMILLARLDAGQAWLVNPSGSRCLEGSFTPRRWMDIGYLLGGFPKVMLPRIIAHNEELLGTETLLGYKVSKIRRTGRAVQFGEERDFTEFFWLAEELCIPLRHENGMIRSDLTKLREQASADSLFTPPAECRKVSSFADLLQ